ncbi:beta-1,3-galactosyltransferase 1-like [Lutzomyia longipalpis]|uniref:beta-1,3-galactosyltransferase 1-like n=1 Tax=Lutzomyia longipalpis TaxID=7200 RepID=UPI002483C048|nr:beta-1,3-galactosyltransferase 1-like [Lutzomyia longipalpis]
MCVKLIEFLPTEPPKVDVPTSGVNSVQIPPPTESIEPQFERQATIGDVGKEEMPQSLEEDPDRKVADLEERINNLLNNADLNKWMKIVEMERYKLEGEPTKNFYDSGFSEPNAMLCPEMGDLLRALILITSAPTHSQHRQDIRETWGSVGQRGDVALGFLVGVTANETTEEALRKEGKLFGDLIRGNSLDSYKNLTLKSVSMLEWMLTYCPMAPYLVKIDDDMLINMERLLTFLEDNSESQRRIFGNIARNWKPHRDLQSKWYLSEENFRNYIYPDFATGPVYVLTGDSVYDLYTTALDMPFLWLEDVFLTGFVAEELKIPRMDLGEVMKRRDGKYSLPCRLPELMAVHEVNTTELHEFWNILHHPELIENCTFIDSKDVSDYAVDKSIDVLNDSLMKLAEEKEH